MHIDKLMVYIQRIPVEFQTITLQNAMHRDSSLINNELIQDCLNYNAERLL